uniref:Uncharacterized protein n=1 Tax=Fundulus heteroclitus TaxID=8078 RepID=A0A3Q2PHN2_FUNHE
MCQVEEEYHEPLERVDRPGVSKKCVKCKEELAAVVIRVGDAYCSWRAVGEFSLTQNVLVHIPTLITNC